MTTPTNGSSDGLITAKQLAHEAGERYDTIDHWSGADLLVYNRRGRRRLYPREENLSRCEKIRELQQDGHSLVTIRGLLQARPKPRSERSRP